MIKISVIIPIYNVEPNYSHVLTVLLCRPFNDFKIICEGMFHQTIFRHSKTILLKITH